MKVPWVPASRIGDGAVFVADALAQGSRKTAMFFTRRLSLDSLIDLCRSMRYALSSGHMPHDTMQLLATQGPRSVRRVARRVADELKSGWGLQDALEKQRSSFPPLFLAMTAVGEESGTLPEVLGELEKYYLLRRKLRRDFLQEIAWPVFQLFAAILVIAGLIYVTGVVGSAQNPSGPPPDPLGIGLTGYTGMVRFLQITFGGMAAAVVLFWLLKLLFRRRALVERCLLYVPLIGSCIRSMVLARFSLAMQLMLAAGLPVRKVLKLAFLASDHPAFTAAYPKAEEALRQGNSITASLAAARVFPADYLGRLAIAEESGQLPDLLAQQAAELDDRAGRRLVLLNRLASWLVWAAIAAIIAFAIFRLFTVSYRENMPELFKPRGEGGLF